MQLFPSSLIHVNTSRMLHGHNHPSHWISRGEKLRITKRTNLAIRVLMFCGANQDRLVTKSEIAQCCNTSENHLAQVINQLGQLGYIRTHRGRNGGLELAREMADIHIGEIFRTLESSVPIAECFADVDNTCPLVEACRLKLAVADAAEAFYAHLDGVTLDALVCDNLPLFEIMSTVSCRPGA